MTSGVTISGGITPLPIALAMFKPNSHAAMKFQNAAQATAVPGRRTRVDTTVEMELAQSWNPLMKSNRSATRMMNTTYST